MRIYPHLQDTGGFFVAVFERTQKGKAPPKPPLALQPSLSASSS
jgi:hypothetical protein